MISPEMLEDLKKLAAGPTDWALLKVKAVELLAARKDASRLPEDEHAAIVIGVLAAIDVVSSMPRIANALEALVEKGRDTHE